MVCPEPYYRDGELFIKKNPETYMDLLRSGNRQDPLRKLGGVGRNEGGRVVEGEKGKGGEHGE